MSEPHDVVKLLVARMESHPEEFGPRGDQRWLDYLHQMDGMLTDEERLMLRGLRMQEIHEQVLDELLNGPDKRRKALEEHEYERNLAKSVQHMKQQQALTHTQMKRQAEQSLQDAYASQLGVGTASSDMNPIRKVLEI